MGRCDPESALLRCCARSAPEVLTGGHCSELSDIYSLGVVLWEICTGETPKRGSMREVRWVVDAAPVISPFESVTAQPPKRFHKLEDLSL